MKRILIPLIALSLAGCYSVGDKIDMAQVNKVEKGQTTRADCERMFGSPTSTTLLADGTTMSYWMHVEARSHAANFIPVYGLVTSKVDTDSQMLQIYFDRDGRVTNISSSSTNSVVKAGLAQ
jgi:outer membrane protein assembly factor BamE (lipoprotein component of BamABCDE complex)